MQHIKYIKCEILYYIFIILIISFGLFLRIKQYIQGFPIWDDEIMFHLNIFNLPFSHCFEQLSMQQISPPLFLVSVKFATLIFEGGGKLFML